MRTSTLAVKGALILLAIPPAAAAAQDANRTYREEMDRLTKKRTVNPMKPGDKYYTCAQIQIELAKLDRQLAGDASTLRAQIEAQDMQNPRELLDAAVAKRLRDAANRNAPVGTAPGNLIEKAQRERAKARDAARKVDNLLLAADLGNDFNFIAARIPYLHVLAEERCTPEEQAVIAHDAAATAGPPQGPTPPGPRRTTTRIEREQGAIMGGTPGAAGKRP